jgi:hypothetical protein
LGVEAAEDHGLIAAKASGFVDSVRIKALEAKILLGSCNKEGRILLDSVKPREVHVAAIHHVDGTRFPARVTFSEQEPLGCTVRDTRNRFTFSGAKLAKTPELIYLLSPRELMPHSFYRAFKAVRDNLGKDLTELTIVNYCEQVPNPESRVFLSQERDRLNMNRLILDWKIGAEETQTLARLQELLAARGRSPIFTKRSEFLC